MRCSKVSSTANSEIWSVHNYYDVSSEPVYPWYSTAMVYEYAYYTIVMSMFDRTHNTINALFLVENPICCSLDPVNAVKDGWPLENRFLHWQVFSFLLCMRVTRSTTDLHGSVLRSKQGMRNFSRALSTCKWKIHSLWLHVCWRYETFRNEMWCPTLKECTASLVAVVMRVHAFSQLTYFVRYNEI